MTKPIEQPWPDHPITIAPNPRRVVVTVNGRVLADTTAALVLRETSYRPVHYIPRGDVDMSRLNATDRATYCPYKGDCSYFSIPELGARGDNAVWSYVAPYPAVAEIAGHLAFYPDRVTIEER